MNRSTSSSRRSRGARGCAAARRLRQPRRHATAPASGNARHQWQAPLPGADPGAELRDWWQQFHDPLLTRPDRRRPNRQPSSPMRARIEQARAAPRGTGGAALGRPRSSRQRQRHARQLSTLASRWAPRWAPACRPPGRSDLFGGQPRRPRCRANPLDGARAQWHDARISVAAETPAYFAACLRGQLAQSELDAASRAETARLTELAAKPASPPASADLARPARRGNATLTQQRAACDLAVKALVALSALPEPSCFCTQLARVASLPQPAQLAVAQVPASAGATP